jgi:HPt (histidine-containing phosphotransfer) domain-containing protein
MLKTFVEELPEDIEAMNAAIENENATLTYQIAHKMKPNLQIFGLRLTANIKILEQWSKSDLKHHEILPYAQEITDKVTLVCQEIKNDYNLA